MTYEQRPAILECTGCGTVTRDRAAQMALYKRAGALSCCPERNMVPVQPAARALVMPDPKPVPVYQVAPLAAESAIGWNNALREVARLNATRPAQTGLVEALRTEALGLCDAVENIDDLPPVKYALQAGRAVNKVRDAVAALSALGGHHDH